ncbi:MAG: peptidase, partial [candidate division NC10 bacterium]|nr:peptidase [candidate division NC10 bacterium]
MDQTRKRTTPWSVGETSTSTGVAGTPMTRGQEGGVRRPKCVWSLVGALLVLAFLVGGAGSGTAAPAGLATPVVYVAPIRGMIDLGLVPYVDRVLLEAANAGAAAVILQIDTFGGRVDAAV